jgi:hypothetical protein
VPAEGAGMVKLSVVAEPSDLQSLTVVVGCEPNLT